ncbi:MAG: aminoglycoside phosphotransferase, partial [Aquihabitans sp.]
MSIPRGPEDVTPAWLGSALGADVIGVDVTPIGTGQTGATYRVSATYAGSRDLPATF